MSDLLPLPTADLAQLVPAPDPRARSGREALAEFDAWLLGEILKQALPEEEDPLLGGGHGGRTYRELWLQEVARVAAQEAGLGLSQQLAPHLEAAAGVAQEEER